MDLAKKLLLGALLVYSLGGCSSQNIQRDCNQLGSGPFFECEKYPWYMNQCARFK
jgi:uncharacterized lipoprotein